MIYSMVYDGIDGLERLDGSCNHSWQRILNIRAICYHTSLGWERGRKEIGDGERSGRVGNGDGFD